VAHTPRPDADASHFSLHGQAELTECPMKIAAGSRVIADIWNLAFARYSGDGRHVLLTNSLIEIS
jgi:hypothetical protein